MSQCEGCAFHQPGTPGAASEANNRLKGLICAHAGIPFFCHHLQSGEEYDWRNSILGPLEHPIEQRKVCEGWKAKVAELARRGTFFTGERPEDRAALLQYQRSLGNGALIALGTFISTKDDPAAKEAARRELADLCRAVFNVPK